MDTVNLSIEARFESFWTHYPLTTDSMAVAFSGGLDSTVLCHLAKAYCTAHDIALSCIHINHGLSQNAAQWQTHCLEFAKHHQIPIHCVSVQITEHEKQALGIEGAARKARYQAFAHNLPAQSALLLAQHEDDQAETFLLQMARGSGPKGLSAMPARRQYQDITLVRPLLNVSRAEIEAYARKHALAWIEDESNLQSRFDRNYLRHEVFPVFKARWPNMTKQIAKSAKRCADEQAVLKDYMKLLAKQLLDEANSLDLTQLSTLSTVTQASFLRYWLMLHDEKMLSSEQVKQVLNFYSAQTDKCPEFRRPTAIIYRYEQRLHLLKTKALKAPLCIDFNAEQGCVNEHMTIQGCDSASADLFVEDTAKLRLQRGDIALNSPFKAYANRPSKPLKQWCREWKIAPILRSQLLVLMCDGQLAAVFHGSWLINQKFIEATPSHSVGLCLKVS